MRHWYTLAHMQGLDYIACLFNIIVIIGKCYDWLSMCYNYTSLNVNIVSCPNQVQIMPCTGAHLLYWSALITFADSVCAQMQSLWALCTYHLISKWYHINIIHDHSCQYLTRLTVKTLKEHNTACTGRYGCPWLSHWGISLTYNYLILEYLWLLMPSVSYFNGRDKGREYQHDP